MYELRLIDAPIEVGAFNNLTIVFNYEYQIVLIFKPNRFSKEQQQKMSRVTSGLFFHSNSTTTYEIVQNLHRWKYHRRHY